VSAITPNFQAEAVGTPEDAPNWLLLEVAPPVELQFIMAMPMATAPAPTAARFMNSRRSMAC
jgi:hypothetical protein